MLWAPKSPYNVASTFFNTVHLLPKDLRFEHADAKLVSCPGRHLTSVRPCVRPAAVINQNFFHIYKTLNSGALEYFTNFKEEIIMPTLRKTLTAPEVIITFRCFTATINFFLTQRQTRFQKSNATKYRRRATLVISKIFFRGKQQTCPMRERLIASAINVDTASHFKTRAGTSKLSDRSLFELLVSDI